MIDKKSYLLKILCILSLFLVTNSAIATFQNVDLIDTTTAVNTAPNPPIIEGPSSGRFNKEYTYSFTLTDPDEDDYLTILEVDFENNIETAVKRNCEQPWYNGSTITLNYKWEEEGTYDIRARVMDSIGEWSEWSEPFPVTMPKNKSIFSIWQSLLKNHFNFPLFNNNGFSIFFN